MKNISFFKLFNSKFKWTRNYEIYLKRINWYKLADIAREYNITSSRVREIYLCMKRDINNFYIDYYKIYWIKI